MNVLVRPERSDDLTAIRDIHTLAFGRPDEAALVDAIRQTPDFIPELSLVAEADEPVSSHGSRIVGHILFTPVTVEPTETFKPFAGEREASKLLGLGPVSVRPRYQRRGIGGQLVQTGLAFSTSMEWPGVVVLGHPNWYPTFGFVPAVQFGLLPPFEVPEDVFLAMSLQPRGLSNMRGKVNYLPPFLNL